MAERMKRRESFSNLIVPVTIDGKPRWWELSASPRLDDQGKYLGFRGVGSDVTEQRASAEQIARMARFHNLTGLPHRLHPIGTPPCRERLCQDRSLLGVPDPSTK